MQNMSMRKASCDSRIINRHPGYEHATIQSCDWIIVMLWRGTDIIEVPFLDESLIIVLFHE